MTEGNTQNIYARRIAVALNGVLGDRPLTAKVGVRQRENLLYIALVPTGGSEPGAPPAYAALLDAEPLLAIFQQTLTDFKADLGLGWLKLVKVSAHLPAQRVPLWQEELLFRSSVAIARTLMQPQPTLSPPALSTRVNLTEGDRRDAAGDVTVQISGDLTGQLIVGDHNRQEYHSYIHNVAHGGVLNVAAAPVVQPRPLPLDLRPRPFAELLDRQTVLPLVRDALKSLLTVEIYGEAGFGKTALIRHLAHESQVVAGFSAGIVYLSAHGQPSADLLQSLYDIFYEANPPFKPSYGQVQQALKERRALIILNGLTLDKAEMEWLLAALPGCTFVLVSDARFYWQEGEAIALKGLPFPESVKLMQKELGYALSEPEQAAAKTLWTALSGNPLQLRRAAAQARAADQSLVDLTQSLQTASAQTISGRSLFQKIVDWLSPDQRHVLALMSAMGGVLLSAEQVQAITRLPKAADILKELTAMRLLESAERSPQGRELTGGYYQLSADLIESVLPGFDPPSWLSQATEYFTAEVAAQGMLPAKSVDAAMHLVEWTQRTGRWQESVALIRGLDQTLALGGRWERWQQVLIYGLRAAEQLGDGATQAWSLHQLGTRSLALGEIGRAEAWLGRAVRQRERLGDYAGAAVTRHNLGLIMPPLVGGVTAAPDRLLRRGGMRRRWPLAVIAGSLLLGVLSSGLLLAQRYLSQSSGQLNARARLSETAIAFGTQTLALTSAPQAVTLTNQGKAPLQIRQLTLSGDEDFALAQPGDCRVELVLTPGMDCAITAVFTPTVTGDRSAQIRLVTSLADGITSSAGKPKSHTVLLSGMGTPQPVPNVAFGVTMVDFEKAFLKERQRQSFTITNSGSAPLSIAAFDIVGRQGREFGLVDQSCTTATLAPQEICEVELWFEPTAAGDRTARLVVKSNADTDSMLSLKGIGVSRSGPQGPDEDLPAETPTESPPAGEPDRSPAATPPAESLSIQANNDSATVAAESSVVIDVLKNDRASAGGQLTIVEVSPGESGQTATDGRQITYSHTGSGSSDRFTYRVRDAAGQIATATVNITVAADGPPQAVNRNPVAIDHYFETRPGEPLTIDLLQGAYDPDPNDVVSLLEIAALSGSGQIEDNGDGTVTYRPSQTGANGTSGTYRSSFKYTVTDGSGGVGQGTVFITVVVPTVN
ncbi:MAG: choice-of-anchor D domain-containing protein [Phormidesmis sp.]